MHMRTIRPEGLTPLALSITLALSLAACGGSGDVGHSQLDDRRP